MKAKLENNWRDKSIENLEKRNYGDPNAAPSNMTKRCLELSKMPVGEFVVEDLRLMIGQGFSYRYLIPLALEQLRVDIFVEGDFYPGDLLKNVLSIDTEFWREHKHLWIEVDELIKNRLDELAKEKISADTFYSILDE